MKPNQKSREEVSRSLHGSLVRIDEVAAADELVPAELAPILEDQESKPGDPVHGHQRLSLVQL